jgi:hypothetical protein
MSMVFAAEVARRICSKDMAHSLWRYLPLMQKAKDDEQRFINWNEHGVRFSPYIHDVSESTRTMRKFIFDLPFAKMRYTEMRLLRSLHPLCGMQHDYPAPRFVAESSKKAFMAALVKRDVPDDAGDAAGRQMLHAQYILPLKDGEFLRKTFPTLRGKLLLVQALLNEEMGIGFANSSPQVFALCQLYNCFLQSSFVDGGWPGLETVMEWHIGKIFLGNMPTKPDEFFSRMLSAMGFSAGVVKKYRDVKKNPDLNFAQGKQTHKTAQLEPLPITNIIRDYMHGRETGLRT